jgi:hypothetical protein
LQRDEKGKGRGGDGEASQATAVTVVIADGAPAGGVGLPAAARDRDSGERGVESSAARVPWEWAIWPFSSSEGRGQPSDRIRLLGRSVGCCHGPWAKKDRAAERAADRIGRTGRWRAVGRQLRQKNSFLWNFFTVYSFVVFCSFFFSKFHIVFSIQIIPTKNLFREFKSYRNFSIKFKVYEFYSCFSCK